MSDDEIQRRRNQVVDDRNFFTTEIGKLVRIVGLSAAGAYFLFSTSTSVFAERLIQEHTSTIVGISALGAAAVLVEWLQYVFAYFLVERAIERADNPSKGGLWPYSFTKRVQKWMLWFKQGFAFAAVLIFVWLMYQTIPSSPSRHGKPDVESGITDKKSAAPHH
jgi:hypothetical protein